MKGWKDERIGDTHRSRGMVPFFVGGFLTSRAGVYAVCIVCMYYIVCTSTGIHVQVVYTPLGEFMGWRGMTARVRVSLRLSHLSRYFHIYWPVKLPEIKISRCFTRLLSRYRRYGGGEGCGTPPPTHPGDERGGMRVDTDTTLFLLLWRSFQSLFDWWWSIPHLISSTFDEKMNRHRTTRTVCNV